MSKGASWWIWWCTASEAIGCRSSGSRRPIIEDIRNGLTADDPEVGEGDDEVAFKEPWVAATVEVKKLKRPLEATAWDAMTSAGDGSTKVAVTTVKLPAKRNETCWLLL
jgi:hypothetical protein